MQRNLTASLAAVELPKRIPEGPRASLPKESNEESLKSRLFAADTQLTEAEKQVDAIHAELFSPQPAANGPNPPPCCVLELAGNLADRLLTLVADLNYIRSRIE